MRCSRFESIQYLGPLLSQVGYGYALMLYVDVWVRMIYVSDLVTYFVD